MQPDVFGDLDKFNGVLAKLDEIASRKSLDEHQVGLARFCVSSRIAVLSMLRSGMQRR